MTTKVFPLTGTDYGMTLRVNAKSFNLAFTHIGPVTVATVVYTTPRGMKAATAAYAVCHPGDAYNQSTGDRLALKRALRIGDRDPWYDGPLGDDADPLYAQFRIIQREADKEKLERELEAEEV